MAFQGENPMGSNSEGASGSKKRKGTPNLRWSQEMDNVLIPCLAELVKMGLKVDKTFKRQAFVEAANVINTKFPNIKVDADKVENHMRTLKERYIMTKKILEDLSGAGWDDEAQMIVLEEETAKTYVAAHPKAKDYINKPIPLFNELRTICGDDHATGSFARTVFHDFGSYGLDVTPNDDNMDPPSYPETEEDGTSIPQSGSQQQQSQSNSTTQGQRPPRTSRNNSDLTLNAILSRLDGMSTALTDFKQHWSQDLSRIVFSLEVYIKDDLITVYEYLASNESLAISFLNAPPEVQHAWAGRIIQRMRG